LRIMRKLTTCRFFCVQLKINGQVSARKLRLLKLTVHLRKTKI
jgi:hypothetical protein